MTSPAASAASRTAECSTAASTWCRPRSAAPQHAADDRLGGPTREHHRPRPRPQQPRHLLREPSPPPPVPRAPPSGSSPDRRLAGATRRPPQPPPAASATRKHDPGSGVTRTAGRGGRPTAWPGAAAGGCGGLPPTPAPQGALPPRTPERRRRRHASLVEQAASWRRRPQAAVVRRASSASDDERSVMQWSSPMGRLLEVEASAWP